MDIIVLESEAFYKLLEEAVSRLKDKHNIKEDKWISGEEAMKKLRITSKSTLQKWRDEGRIRFFQADRKHILYDTASIDEYLSNHSKDTF